MRNLLFLLPIFLTYPNNAYAQPEYNARLFVSHTFDGTNGNDAQSILGRPRFSAMIDLQYIAVSDEASGTVKVYDTSTGDLFSVIGNRGRGPGEFISIDGIDTLGDSLIFVSDNSLRRVTYFDIQGNIIEEISIDNYSVPLPHNSISSPWGDIWIGKSLFLAPDGENIVENHVYFFYLKNKLTIVPIGGSELHDQLISNQQEELLYYMNPGDGLIFDNQIYYIPYYYHNKIYRFSFSAEDKSLFLDKILPGSFDEHLISIKSLDLDLYSTKDAIVDIAGSFRGERYLYSIETKSHGSAINDSIIYHLVSRKTDESLKYYFETIGIDNNINETYEIIDPDSFLTNQTRLHLAGFDIHDRAIFIEQYPTPRVIVANVEYDNSMEE